MLAVAAMRGTNNWIRGVRCGAVPVIGGIIPLHVGLLADVVETLEGLFDDPRSASWDTRLDAASVDNYAIWTVPIVVVAFVAVVWFVTRWPELDDLRAYAATAVAGAVALGSVDAVVTMRLPIWAVAVVLLVVAGGLLAAQARGLVAHAGPAAAGAVAAASGLTASSQGSPDHVARRRAGPRRTRAREGPGAFRQSYAALSVPLGLGGIAALVDLLDIDDSVTPLVTLVCALVVIGATACSATTRADPGRGIGCIRGVRGPAGAGSTADLAVRWTIAGVALMASAPRVLIAGGTSGRAPWRSSWRTSC